MVYSLYPRRFVGWLCILLLFTASAILSSRPVLAERGFCSKDKDFKPSKISLDDLPAEGSVYFYCGLPLDPPEPIKLKASGLPKNSTLTPKSSSTNARTKLQLGVKDNTEVGQFEILLGATGTRCSTYTVCKMHITVAPYIYGPKKFWWFNGYQTSNSFPPYTQGPYTTKLSAKPAGQSKYTWQLESGSQFAELADGLDNNANRGAKIVTSDNEVYVVDKKTVDYKDVGTDIQTIGQLPPNSLDIAVTVKVSNVTSQPYNLKLMRPKEIAFAGVFPKDQGDLSTGYISPLKYIAKDNRGNAMPGNVVARETFNDGTHSHKRFQHGQTLTSNWTFPQDTQQVKPGGSDPNNLIDKITGMAKSAGPRNPRPEFPGNNGEVDPKHIVADSWYGGFFIGGPKRLTGVMVAKMYWIRFLDHGRHCNLQSPPESGPKYPCNASPFGAPP